MKTFYSDISQKALDVKDKYNLSEEQTTLYDLICRGDFKLKDGRIYIDYDNKEYHDKTYINKLMKPLINDGLVKLIKLRNIVNLRYTNWYWYCPEFVFDSLVGTDDYHYPMLLVKLKQILNLPDGFDKRNKTYGDITFLQNQHGYYSFIYKNEPNLYFWDYKGYGNGRKLFYETTHYEYEFSKLLTNVRNSIVYDQNQTKNENS